MSYVSATDQSGANQQLWDRLLHAVKSQGLSLHDLYNCDQPARLRLLTTLGFKDGEQQELAKMIQDRAKDGSSRSSSAAVAAARTQSPGAAAIPSITRDGPTPMNASSSGTNLHIPGAGMTGHNTPAVSTTSYPNIGTAGGLSTAATPRAGTPTHPAGLQSSPFHQQQPQQANSPFGALDAHQGGAYNASAISGLSFVNNQVVARCSVYPDLPAEFWCAACNVLVSSRCHVQGAHKDHPFIPIRLAAEQHVSELSSWAERARVQLNSTESVLNNLRHAETQIGRYVHNEFEKVDKDVDQIVEDLMRWKEQLKYDMQQQAAAQVTAIQTSARRTEELNSLYVGQLRACEPLLANTPPVDQNDRISDEWALRLLDFVSKLKNVTAEPIPMPKLTIPEVTCTATPSTHMELIKMSSKPMPVRLPDLVDPGYFNFPHPSASTRVPFTLSEPVDAKQKGINVFQGKTLTRAEDVQTNHSLVTGTQVFYSGTVSWEVHIDRLGSGPGRILAGVVVHGSDGEGVVWDGHRIVGPNEGESRTIDEKFVLKVGTILRFVLELEGQQRFLNCFFDRDGVARVPLPPSGSGWVPAFSVFGPQDQVTVIGHAAEGADSAASPVRNAASAAREAGSPAQSKILEQEALIASLQQQLNAVSQRMDREQMMRIQMDSQRREESMASPPRQQTIDPQQQQQRGGLSGSRTSYAGGTPNSASRQQYQQLPPTPQRPEGLPPAPYPSPATGTRGRSAEANSAADDQPPAQGMESYSPELRQLMTFVNSGP